VTIAFTLPVVLLVSNVLHELGHGLAALAVGYRIRGFIVGGRGSDFARDGGFLQFGRKFGRAAAMITPGRGWISGWRGMVTYGGGPAVNLLIVALTAHATFAFVFADGLGVAAGLATVYHLVAAFFFLVNARSAVLNLVPRVSHDGEITDGKHLTNLVRQGRVVEWIKIAESSVDIDRPRRAVWEFLEDPMNITVYDLDVERAYTKPGTSPGVGRVTVTHMRPAAPGEAARVVEKEIVAYDPPRRVMERSVRHHSLRTETLLRTVGSGATRLTRTVWLGMKPLAPEQRERMRSDLAEVGPRLAAENDRIRRQLAPEATEILAVGVRRRRHAAHAQAPSRAR
jgi:hypothetical protein